MIFGYSTTFRGLPIIHTRDGNYFPENLRDVIFCTNGPEWYCLIDNDIVDYSTGEALYTLDTDISDVYEMRQISTDPEFALFGKNRILIISAEFMFEIIVDRKVIFIWGYYDQEKNEVVTILATDDGIDVYVDGHEYIHRELDVYPLGVFENGVLYGYIAGYFCKYDIKLGIRYDMEKEIAVGNCITDGVVFYTKDLIRVIPKGDFNRSPIVGCEKSGQVVIFHMEDGSYYLTNLYIDEPYTMPISRDLITIR